MEIIDPNNHLVPDIQSNIEPSDAISDSIKSYLSSFGKGWSFIPGYYNQFNMYNVVTHKCVEIDESRVEPLLAACKYADPSQSFEIIQKGRNALPQGYIQIVNAATKKCIKAKSNLYATQVDCGDKSDQETIWKIHEGVGGGYHFESKNGVALGTDGRLFGQPISKNAFQSFLISPYETHILLISVANKKCIELVSDSVNAELHDKVCELKELQYYYFDPVLDN